MNIAATRQATAVSIFDSVTGDVTLADCAPSESLLLVGLRAGLDLPYECASGGCGSCRAQLLDGVVATRWPDATGLTERDRRRGNRILLCQSLPDTDCQVRVALPAGRSEHAGDALPPAPARSHATLSRRVMLTGDTARLLVELSEPIRYLAGQFVILEFADGVRRAYSMSRPSDRDATELELLVRAKPGGDASAWIFERLDEGASIVVEGPYGRAHAQTPGGKDAVCLAGGTGLAPVLAIAEDLMERSPGRGVDVYVGARRMEDLVLADRLYQLGQAGARVVPVVEGPVDLPHPVLGEVRCGLALDHLASDLPDLTGHDVYLAGPTPMIDASLRRLVREGTADAGRVFFDRFIA